MEANKKKMEEQLRKFLDVRLVFATGNKQDYYKNEIRITAPLNSGEQDRWYRFIPEQELIDMQRKGFEDNFDGIQNEKEVLKSSLLEMQSRLNTIMVDLIQQLRDLDQEKQLLCNLRFDREKLLYIQPMMLDAPLTKIGSGVS